MKRQFWRKLLLKTQNLVPESSKNCKLFFFFIIEIIIISRENSLNCKRIHIQRWFSYRNKKLRKIKIKEQCPSILLILLLIYFLILQRKTEKASQINVDQVFTNNQKEIQQTSSPTENIQNNSNANINRSNFLSMQQMFQPLNQFPTFPIDWKNFANYQMLNNWNFTSQYLNSLQTNMANAYQNYFTRRYFQRKKNRHLFEQKYYY